MRTVGTRSFHLVFSLLGILLFSMAAFAQSTGNIQGNVTDASGAAVPNAKVIVHNVDTGVDRLTQTDSDGNYQAASLPAGNYTVTIEAPGMQKMVRSNVQLDVARSVPVNASLKIGSASETVTVVETTPVIETTTQTVSQVINQRTVQEIPLNGRHFVDLGLLIPGSVTPPQNGFLTAPLRGQGSFAFNTAGQREDAVNFMVNGINLNDGVQNQITFQPSINTVSEFKVDNSTYSAESGRSSGAIVNIATRSGTNDFHGELFEFIRNNALDARNAFNPTTQPQSPFKRNQFGGAIGGPIIRNRTFFFGSYEGLRQRQGLNTSSAVLSAAQRTTALASASPAIVALTNLIPVSNATDAAGNPIFLGSAVAPVNIDQWTGDVRHNISDVNQLHVYYAFQRDFRKESTQGANIPGYGDTRQSHRQIFTLNHTYSFSSTLVNEARLGFNRIHITFVPNSTTDPSTIGIGSGPNPPAALPSLRLPFLGLTFGGLAGEPQGRGDTTMVLSDTVSWLRGKHSFKFGGEARDFRNNNFNSDVGTLSFSTFANYAAGLVTSFSRTPGSTPTRINEGSLDFFVQDNYKLLSYLTLELGLRYSWNMTPSEAQNRFVTYLPGSNQLVQVGNGIDPIYQQSNKNFQPRVGFAWDVFHDGNSVLRGGYGYQVMEPATNYVSPLGANPPLVNPVSFNGAGLPIATIFSAASSASGVAPRAINPNFHNAYTQSYNLNFQQALSPSLALMVGYFGSVGVHLEIDRNINQPVNGVLPFSTLASTSPILPGAPLGRVRMADSSATSNYNALWVSANKRLSHGVQFNASFTWSHSIDDNSQNSEGIVVQDSNNIRGDRADSDFDVRRRIVLNAIYDLPFTGNRAVQGWELSTIVQLQSGNPFTIFANNPSGVNLANFNGVGNIRPDAGAPVVVNPGNTRYFTAVTCDPRTTPVCPANTNFILPVSFAPGAAVVHFGNVHRNSLTGPGFANVDFSILKTTKITERLSTQFRTEFFDILNHPNFGQPASTAGIATFGVINSTRFPTGDSGSSRQIQFALKLIF